VAYAEYVTLGQQTMVTVNFRNVGEADITINDTPQLIFDLLSTGASADTDYDTVTMISAPVPFIIGAYADIWCTYTLTVNLTAGETIIEVDASGTAVESNLNSSLYVDSALLTDTWTVQSPARLYMDTVALLGSDTEFYEGQSGIQLRYRVKNLGGADARITLDTGNIRVWNIVFSKDVTDSFTSLTNGNGLIVSGGDSREVTLIRDRSRSTSVWMEWT